MKLGIQIVTLALPILLASCAAYGPYHPNTSGESLNSVRGPADGRYKLAFVEFGDQGSALDTSQRVAALGVIHEAKRPLLFVYIHGWHNDANFNELALAARAPGKDFHHCVLLGHSFGGLVLENTISHSILDASSNGSRNSSPWDMAVAFNPADSSTGSRQLMSEFDYLFNLRFHWDQVPVPGGSGRQLSEGEFYTQTPGNNKYLVNYHVVPLGEATPPPGLKAADNRAFEANIRQNLQDNSFYTSERNDGHEDRFCRDANYNPNVIRPPTGRELWRRWQFVYTGNARVPCWIVRVPKEPDVQQLSQDKPR